MVDLTDPSPLVMTRLEFTATVTAFSVLALVIAIDVWKAWKRRKQP